MISVGALFSAVSSANAAVMMVGSNTAYPGSLENVFSSIHYSAALLSQHPSLWVWDPEWAPLPGNPKGGYRPKTTVELNANPLTYVEESASQYSGTFIELSETSWGLYFNDSTAFNQFPLIHTPVLVDNATYFAVGFFVKGNEWFYTHYNWYTTSEATTPSFTWVYWFGHGWLGCFGNGWVWDATANTFSWTTPETFPIGYQP